MIDHLVDVSPWLEAAVVVNRHRWTELDQLTVAIPGREEPDHLEEDLVAAVRNCSEGDLEVDHQEGAQRVVVGLELAVFDHTVTIGAVVA